MNYPEYIILEDWSYTSLAGKIMMKMDEGWKLQGGVAMTTNAKNERTFAQAMVRGMNNETED